MQKMEIIELVQEQVFVVSPHFSLKLSVRVNFPWKATSALF